MIRALMHPAEATLSVKGSKFVAYAAPFLDVQEREGWLRSIRALHPKARHVGSAFRWDLDWERWDDDGEPSGSTGRPILHALQSAEAVRTGVAVVRYFGGTLLGVPGLIRAYRGAAELALDAGTWAPFVPQKTGWVRCAYPELDTALRWIRETNGRVLEQNINQECRLHVELPLDQWSAWEARCAQYGSPVQLEKK